MKMQYQKYWKMQFCTKLHIDIWEVILYFCANPCRLKPRILMASFLLVPLLNWMTSVNDIFCFIGLAFIKKKRKRACCIFMLFFKIKLWNNITWFWCSEQTRFFENALMVILIRLKYFHDIVLILAPGYEFFWAKCV